MRRFTRAVPVALLVASLAALFGARPGESVPLYAARTGLQCQNCHFDPNGGGPRNEFGFAFAKNRHAIEPEGEASPWKDLALTNRVGDTFPLYVGVNQRFMALTGTSEHSDSLDRAGFYNMENALHLTLQPHARLTLVYTRDGFDGGSSTKEAFGLIGGLPLDGYLKAGRFRTPFGLRMDDHGVATRNGFLDFYSASVPFAYFDSVQTSFLPYDPRQPDMGVEWGGAWSDFFGRVAITNGVSHPLTRPATAYAGAKTVKLGYHRGNYQGGLSLYDEFVRDDTERLFGSPSPTSPKRATRWGYFGLAHVGPLAFLGEVAAGTNEFASLPGTATGPKMNNLAWWVEADWAPVRQANVRLRYDWMSLARGAPDEYLRDLNTHRRMALEAEWVPVPFAELRWTLRRIEHEADRFRDVIGSAVPIRDETQTYLQFHFSY